MALYEIDNRYEAIDFEITSDDMVERTIRNAKNLLMTRMGEIPYDRLRGFDASLFDLPIKTLNERLIRELDRVMMWEPDVEVADAEATIDENGEVYIRVTIEIDFEK